jgi:hypothetical protein
VLLVLILSFRGSSDSWTDLEAISEWPKANFLATHRPGRSSTEMIANVVTQSVPAPTFSELAVSKFTPADWGNGKSGIPFAAFVLNVLVQHNFPTVRSQTTLRLHHTLSISVRVRPRRLTPLFG